MPDKRVQCGICVQPAAACEDPRGSR
jgi:hypothetical protein